MPASSNSLLPDVRELQRERRQLALWLQNIGASFGELTQSKRWRFGNLLGDWWCRLRGLGAPPTAADAVRDTLTRFQRWHESRELGELLAPEVLLEQPAPKFPPHDGVDIIVCVHNALSDVQSCLASVAEHTSGPYRLILVDDGSDAETAAFLKTFAGRSLSGGTVDRIRHETALGYTRAANQGLMASQAAHTVLLNSDTIVGPYWLDRLLECARSDENIGLVGPLSNAASWQSSPGVYTGDGQWSRNPLPSHVLPAEVALGLGAVSPRLFPRVPLLNGFCLLLKRAVIDRVGTFDSQLFPEGYGEENDYCLRAGAAGFSLAVADQTYVFHAKSRSYGDERRRALAVQGSEKLAQRWGAARIEAAERELRQSVPLAEARGLVGNLVRALAQRERPAAEGGAKSPCLGAGEKSSTPRAPRLKILFLLPAKPGGGGVHSVVQEASGMRRMGVEARVAIPASQQWSYHEHYPQAACDQLFLPYEEESRILEVAAEATVAVATIAHSMVMVRQIVSVFPSIVPAYYVQDYEPRFHTPHSPAWHEARRSYTLLRGTTLFAKTAWLCREVERQHATRVHQIPPGLDHDVFFPAYDRTRAESVVAIAAMVRPQTPRRGAPRTLAALRELHQRHGNRVAIHIFGCRDEELTRHRLACDFPFTNHGPLSREQVAGVLRACDYFFDFSDYQAFGRTALEAMACGCVPVVPAAGGATEYARHEENALVIDTGYAAELPSASFERIVRSLDDRGGWENMRRAALAAAAQYSVGRTVVAQLELFSDAVKRMHEQGESSVSAGEELCGAENQNLKFGRERNSRLTGVAS